jgi:hypothetical protein
MWDQLTEALSSPSKNMTWPQLAASVVFILIVLIAWRQVVRFIVE